MGTTAEKLQAIVAAKEDIGAAIAEKGGTVPQTLAAYGDAIRALPGGGGFEIVKIGDDRAALDDLACFATNTLSMYNTPFGSMVKISVTPGKGSIVGTKDTTNQNEHIYPLTAYSNVPWPDKLFSGENAPNVSGASEIYIPLIRIGGIQCSTPSSASSFTELVQFYLCLNRAGYAALRFSAGSNYLPEKIQIKCTGPGFLVGFCPFTWGW